MSLLIHSCCGQCLCSLLDVIRQPEGSPRSAAGAGSSVDAATGIIATDAVACLFDNPNIHPLIEFRRRLKAFRILCEQVGLPALVNDEYELAEFLDAVDYHSPERRCLDCYRLRLERTAERARAGGFDSFTTTLLVSPQQKHDQIRRIGEEAAREAGVRFLYHDWRDLCERGHQEARRRKLYLQQYCGCIFSEAGRYGQTRLHLYRGGDGGGEADET
ncbi:MAG: epoxyqueuosine reductase QueH [Phycisphaerae bacterium]|nr:epoxyqueuosine reductase QueH [Phycisphaerae bacterium]